MRFSIRDLLLLTVIVALTTGWALDRWRLAKQNADLSQEIRKLTDLERAHAAQLTAMKRSLQQHRELIRQLDARLVDAERVKAINDELASRGYSGSLRGMLPGPVHNRVPPAPTTQLPDSDN